MNALLWVFSRITCAQDAVLFPSSLCNSQIPSCLILVDLLHKLHKSSSPFDKPTYVSEVKELQVDGSLIYAGDKGCWSMIMIVCLCQWFKCHSLCNYWQSTWQSLQTYQAKTTNACVYSHDLKGWICHGVICCISSLLKFLMVKIFHLCSLFANIFFQQLRGQRLKYASALLTEFDFSNDVSENPGFICRRVKSFSNNLTLVLNKKVAQIIPVHSPIKRYTCNFCVLGLIAPFFFVTKVEDFVKLLEG